MNKKSKRFWGTHRRYFSLELPPTPLKGKRWGSIVYCHPPLLSAGPPNDHLPGQGIVWYRWTGGRRQKATRTALSLPPLSFLSFLSVPFRTVMHAFFFFFRKNPSFAFGLCATLAGRPVVVELQHFTIISYLSWFFFKNKTLFPFSKNSLCVLLW